MVVAEGSGARVLLFYWPFCSIRVSGFDDFLLTMMGTSKCLYEMKAKSSGTTIRLSITNCADIKQLDFHYLASLAEAIRKMIVNVELQYGGSLANHCKLLLQVAQAVAATIGANQLVVKISPTIDYLDAMDSHPCNVGLAVIEILNKVQFELGSKLGYLHVTQLR
ncbi:hypothetical protein L1987_64107 [Smallanthus sonchifolius]|uniref:Uncharacterized protein n=1 Tax=Smallanthus sonchifolius TaxID=185202 RepID=A0ACB9CF61_9ASTR|nr:hypothetical protein L1987_64107 [Smallanthus sonchifolius]